MIKSIKLLRNSTTFKLAVAAGISFILYELATFLFPILLAIGLAFALYPVSNMFSKITVGQGTIHLSRVVAIILAFMAFGMFMFFAVTFFCCLCSGRSMIWWRSCLIIRQKSSLLIWTGY